MNILSVLLFSLASSIFVISSAFAGPERVSWPENYASTFVRYDSVDKPKADKPAKIRLMYVNPESITQAKAGQPLPEGTILIMEDRTIKLDENGDPSLDKQGRFIPTNEITGVIIQQKQTGWGAAFPEELRNGDWDYAVFDASGVLKDNIDYNACLACHKGQAAADYNFTFTPFLSRINK